MSANANIQALANAIIQAIQQQQAQPLTQPTIVFAATPGRANPDQPIDYTTRIGHDLWKQATAPLPHKFDAESGQVNQFIEDLRDRAVASGWTAGQGNIIEIPDTNGSSRNLILQYGQLSKENIRNHVASYLGQDNSRRSQNAQQMYYCIMASLSEAGKNKILSESDHYIINGEFSGPDLFKLLMNKTIIDTRATSTTLLSNLMNLDDYMATCNSNIELFNQYAKVNYEGLKARGEDVPSFIVYLFKGYKAAADEQFRKYIQYQRDAYDQGENMDHNLLMTRALNKYKTMMDENEWCAMSPQEEQIVALSAELKQLKDSNLKLSRSVDQKPKSKVKEGRNRKPVKGKKKKGDDHTWKKTPPKLGDPETKIVNKKTYHWCKYHNAWTEHEPEGNGPNACRLRQKLDKEENESKKSAGSSKNKPDKKVPFANALAAILDEGNIEDCE